ncbi:S9 family peptidase [Planosporangium flavigriseum]|uniref:Acyl-peptide hydrolase n=1 Tax=Planosporangium flavigriseum TaxID=373681 RepID=A0A8J3LRJ2_9ACTN|nr:prolyl oligopeptidase family serine peptidase [Planosporangium flavigriseum]NJC67383.1 S9 family peptidase [Planosporangium flavigriseum]GIG75470.1 acyl-peptide hydrolase [Planosporangium flavigriseum]
MRDLPYGGWPSPISAADLARSGVTLGFVAAVGDEIWWEETRPAEGGRTAVARRSADGTVVDALPRPWNARTRVHEYGGRAWLPVPTADGPALLFTQWDDQRLYLLEDGAHAPRPLTPEPGEPGTLRYADLVLDLDRGEALCVREAHHDGRVTRHIVAVPLDGSAAADPTRVREVAGGSDFLAYPRVSPDGRRIAWIAWDHPRMPWDGTELRVADLDRGVATSVRPLLGGPEESVLQPEWVDDATLYAISDRSGWWNLYRVPVGDTREDGGQAQALCPREEEFAFPLWMLGRVSYAMLGDGRLAVLHGAGTYRLGILDPEGGALADLETPFTVWSSTLAVSAAGLVGVAASGQEPPTVVRVDPDSGAVERLRPALDRIPDPAYLPQPRSEALPGPHGRVVHAHIYPPRNPEAWAPEGEKPPYVVFVHGGPTGQSLPVLKLDIAYFTSRGIGVVDVDYGGSAGYGRAYRELLRGQWGVVDVEDCVAAAQALVDRGEADGARLAIRGGSAGGWTTLAALTSTAVFAAGTSYFGVAELLRFVQDTHDFESRYIDGLVGPLPESRDRYVQRAPLSHVNRLSCPVLLLQGSDDRVVPPSQSLMFRDALAAKGIPHAYLEFEGEQHGFRMESTIVAAHEAELSFYGQVLGFNPPGVPTLKLAGGESARENPGGKVS